MQKLLPPILFFICLITMLLLHLLFPTKTVMVPPYTYIGAVLLITGLFLAKHGSGLFEAQKTNIQTFDDPDKLITSGVFSYSRNPMYLGFFASTLGWAILLGSLTPYSICLMFFAITNWWYIRFEEKRMHAVFGEHYVEYCNSVRRWF